MPQLDRQSLPAVGFVLLLLTVAWHVFLFASNPSSPDLLSGRVYEVNMHGSIVYATLFEQIVRYVLFLGAALAFLLSGSGKPTVPPGGPPDEVTFRWSFLDICGWASLVVGIVAIALILLVAGGVQNSWIPADLGRDVSAVLNIVGLVGLFGFAGYWVVKVVQAKGGQRK